MRIFVTYVFPFLLPFIGYGLYVLLAKRGQDFLADTPWFLLSVIGLLCIAVTFGYLAFNSGDPAGGVYVPPHMQDGQIVPGRVVPADG